MRVLIVSNMDSNRPYGGYTRPFYIGRALSQWCEVCQVGFDCSAVKYCSHVCVETKSLKGYLRVLQKVIKDFEPDIIYAHETFAGFAAYLIFFLPKTKKSHLIFDFHSVSAYEYKTMARWWKDPIKFFYRFAKAYLPQKRLAKSGYSIVAASLELKRLISTWYRIPSDRITVVPNGAPSEFVNLPKAQQNPYPCDGHKHLLVIAPRITAPANILAVNFTHEVAQELKKIDGGNMCIYIIGGGWRKRIGIKYTNLKYLCHIPSPLLLPYIDYADICLLPFPKQAICGGARNKALDFFARGKIVISTFEGLRGLSDFQHLQYVFISSYDPVKFVNDICRVLKEQEQFEYLGENARRLVLEAQTWEHSARKVFSKFCELLEDNREM